MRLLKWLAVIAVTAGFAAAAGYIVRDAADDEAAQEGSVHGQLYSQILGEDRQYTVYLPEGYDRDTGRKYPVIYVLDGGSQAGPAAASAATLARIGVIPRTLVVGVTVDGDTRNRDYTPPGMRMDLDDPASPMGAGDRFLDFLREELIAEVDRNYRTGRPRVLSGWSRSGLLVVYSLKAAPDLFDARIAHSPALWRGNDAIVSDLERVLKGTPAPSGFLFLSLGDQENEKMTTAFKHGSAILGEHAPPELRWQTYWSRGGDHETNPRLSGPVALCALFHAERAACDSDFEQD